MGDGDGLIGAVVGLTALSIVANGMRGRSRRRTTTTTTRRYSKKGKRRGRTVTRTTTTSPDYGMGFW